MSASPDIENPMISYAQNAEDVVLSRAFAGQAEGIYIDIGASDPHDDSVTQHFYALGWHGINVEPDDTDFNRLVTERPRDVNLRAAVGSGPDSVRFFATETRGHGTLDEQLAHERGSKSVVQVEMRSLASIFQDFAADEEVDFLKIDVEGWEANVIASGDWSRDRPRVVVVEAVDEAGLPTHEAWEPTLVGSGYELALYDGLNRFYYRAEDAAHLAPLLSAPANVTDNWQSAREAQAQTSLAECLARESADNATKSDLLAQIEQLRAEATDLGIRLASAESARKDAERAAAYAESAAATAESLVEQIHLSTSWRVTTPLRDASRLIRLFRPAGGSKR